MADYEARRGNSGSPEEEKARADQNNAKNLRNAADVAMATKNPYAMAAGAAVKTADKVTGGKSTEALGKAMTQANKVSPAGKQMQNLSNKLAESGASDKIGKAASLYNSAQGKGADAGGNAAGNAASGAASGANAASGGPTPNQVKNKKTSGGEQDSSLPSSGENKNKNNPPSAGGLGNKNGEKEEKEDKSDSSSSSQQEEKKDSIFSFFALSPLKVMAFGALSSGLLIVLMILVAASVVSDIFGDYEDGIGMSATLNDETGNTTFRASTPEQQEFYDRVAEVKNEYQSNGKTVDALKVVSVYHVLKSNGADVSYEKMSKSDIEEIADAMFDDNNSYSEEIFKSNLKNSIFPKYISGLSDGKKEDMADEVIDYVERYKKLVARDTGSTCSGGGNCSYDIKGFYIGDRGNVTESLQISNLYVRLMQCGGQYGGTWGQPMAGEDLVEFENYILGVAYQEIGPSAPAEAFKAQMVAARSYSFARHVVMGVLVQLIKFIVILIKVVHHLVEMVNLVKFIVELLQVDL